MAFVSQVPAADQEAIPFIVASAPFSVTRVEDIVESSCFEGQCERLEACLPRKHKAP